MSKRGMSDYLNIGISIAFCTAGGILLGILLDNPVLYLCIGAGIGVVVGAVLQLYKKKK
ncbi:MAG: hypothetical protein GX136_02590 [Clostridiales bacterium]|nr:hypothetical protein [Clostridiales bacterium]